MGTKLLSHFSLALTKFINQTVLARKKLRWLGPDFPESSPVDPDASVADLLQNLNLTADEEDVAEFNDDEDVDASPVVEWALFGKVLSPAVVHPTTIFRAMKPTWGNPYGLNIRSIGEKQDNLFVAEFNLQQDMEWALGSSPWMVGQHALLLQAYDESVRPLEIKFDCMDIWIRILNLPLG